MSEDKLEDKSEDALIHQIFISGGRGGVHNAELEAELSKRLLYSIVNLNKSTTLYSKWLIGLTIMLALLVIVQIIIAICG
jgi:hypothetical protein